MDERGPSDDGIGNVDTAKSPRLSTSARLFQSAMADEPGNDQTPYDPTKTTGMEDFVRHLDQQERMRGPRTRIPPMTPRDRPQIPDLDFSSLTQGTRDAVGEKVDL